METCTALNLSDSSKCAEPATNKTGLFCEVHAHQVQGLYQGYKRRSQELDALEEKQPASLPKSLSTTDFSSINDSETLTAIHVFLLKKFNLTNRCLTARDYHHSHFYKDTSDYGHQVYLDRLRSSRIILAQALHRLEKRMLDVNYNKTQWYSWVESLQAESDTKSEAEKKKVKAEAALFKKHQTNVNKLREEEAARKHEEDEKADVWDPIESIIENSRAGYVALIKVMILAENTTKDDLVLAVKRGSELKENLKLKSDTLAMENSKRSRNRKALRMGPDRNKYQPEAEEEVPRSAKGKKKKKRPAQEATVESDDEPDNRMIATALANLSIADDSSPAAIEGRINKQEYPRQIKIISEFVLLRLIIANPSLLTTAMASPSIDDFLHNTTNVRNTDLRDLGLDLSCPSLKLMKSACLDYWVAEAMKGQDNVESQDKGKGKDETARSLPKKLHPDRLALWRDNKVKVCGKWVYNPPSEFTLPRDGWSQFSMMMTDCSLWDAISVCNSWDEFFDLNILIMNDYFPRWARSQESQPLQYLRRLGLIPYSESPDAAKITKTVQAGGRGSGRTYQATEARNYLCATISRDEPGANRFINFIRSYNTQMVCYVKDCLTGQVICNPPDKEKWLVRDKEGFGRASGGKWVVRQSFDRAFRTNIEETRPWKLQFNDYLDVVVWDRHPGWEPSNLQAILTSMMHKAYKYKDPVSIMEPTLRVFHRSGVREINPLIIEHVRETFKAYLSRNPLRPEILPELFYDSLDEETDEKYSIYDKDPRIGNDDKPDEKRNRHSSLEEVFTEFLYGHIFGSDPRSGKQSKKSGKEKWKNGDGTGKVWEIAEYEAEDLMKKVEGVTRIFIGEEDKKETIDADTLRRKAQEYARDWKFVEGITNAKKRASALAELDSKNTLRHHAISNDGYDPYNRRFGRTLTDILWGEEKLMEACFRSLGVKSVATLKDVEARAKNPPPRRPPVCSTNAYAEWDKFKGSSNGAGMKPPKEHERTIRRTLMRLWNDGIIRPSWSLEYHVLFAGRANNHNDYHMFVDYRPFVQNRILRSPAEDDPTRKPPPGTRYLRDEMEKFESKNRGAVYSLMRVRSEPEYWDASTTYEDIERLAVIDPSGRIWEWLKLPKDQPFCAWSIHDLIATLLPDVSRAWEIGMTGADIKSRIDTILVMAKDEPTCRLWTEIIMALINGRLPRGFDPDLPRSFLRVNAAFLRRLPEVWWE